MTVTYFPWTFAKAKSKTYLLQAIENLSANHATQTASYGYIDMILVCPINANLYTRLKDDVTIRGHQAAATAPLPIQKLWDIEKERGSFNFQN